MASRRRFAAKDAGAGLWETVSGRVEADEAPLDAIAREVREETGLVVAIDPRPGDVKHSMADASRAKSGFGWEATTDLESGLARAAEYYS